jgi:hypothetical protein
MDETLLLIATLVSLIPGAYFAWRVIKGAILALRQRNDDDL